MKKLIPISILLGLASTCAFADDTPATNALSSGLSTATASNPVPATPDYQSKTTSTIAIKPRDNLIIATSITHWDPKASDSLAIRWLAPRGYCQSSTFNITRGPNSHHDVFWAYRTVVHTTSKGNTVTCQGHWVAQVINTTTGKILATAAYDVAPSNKLPLAGDAPLPDANSTDTSSTQ